MEDAAKARRDLKMNEMLGCPDAGRDGQQHKVMGTGSASLRAAFLVPQPGGAQGWMGLLARLLSLCSSFQAQHDGRKARSNTCRGGKGVGAEQSKKLTPLASC